MSLCQIPAQLITPSVSGGISFYFSEPHFPFWKIAKCLSSHRMVLRGCSIEHLAHWDVSLPSRSPGLISDCVNLRPQTPWLCSENTCPRGNLGFLSVCEDPVVLVSLPTAVIKCSAKCTLRNKGFLLGHSSRAVS